MELATSITSQGQVTIPVSIRRHLGLRPSDKVEFLKENGRVYIKPSKDFLQLKGTLKSKRKYTDSELDKLILEQVAHEQKKKVANRH